MTATEGDLHIFKVISRSLQSRFGWSTQTGLVVDSEGEPDVSVVDNGAELEFDVVDDADEAADVVGDEVELAIDVVDALGDEVRDVVTVEECGTVWLEGAFVKGLEEDRADVADCRVVDTVVAVDAVD